jgi:transposase-like protein
MSKKIFTQEQIADLLKNENVVSCSAKSITYAKEFKIKAVKLYQDDGVPAGRIFSDAGFDLRVVSAENIRHRLIAWRKTFHAQGAAGLCVKGQDNNPCRGRPKTRYVSDAEKIERLEATVAYLKAENDFLAKLRAGQAE